MKKIILLLAFVPLIWGFTPYNSFSQTTTGHIYCEYYIDDPTFINGTTYYEISVRIETTTPWIPSYVSYTTVYDLNVHQINNVIFYNVPYPRPIPPDFYIIRVRALKNGSTPANNASYATPSYIDAFNTRFDADTDPIQVKF
jgi:hypothetical protein